MEWICKECASYNDGSDQRCAVCAAPRPRAVRRECPECKLVQEAFDGMRCVGCGRLFSEEDIDGFGPAPRPYPLYGCPYPEPPGPYPPTPSENKKRSRAPLIIAVAAIIVVGVLAALFIVKYFDSRETGGGNAEPAAATAAQETGAQAAADSVPAADAPAGRLTESPTERLTAAATAAPATAPPVTYTAVVTTAYVPAQVSYPVAYVSGQTPDHAGINMRSEPSSGSSLIVTLREGAQVYVLGSTSGEYTLVQTVNGGDRGWVLERYLVAQGDQAPAPYPVSRVSYQTPGHAGINLRAEPTANSGLIATLAEGTAVYCLSDTEGDYTYVETVDGGVRGWVMWKYLN